MTPKERITGALNGADRDATGKALQDTLVELVDLHLSAKQAHWNVIGRFFRDVHLQLDELVTTAREYADSVAERSAALGVPPDGRSDTVSGESNLPKLEGGWRADRDVVEYIVRCLETTIHRLRARIDETDKTDQVTQDLLIALAAKLEESHWMWQAQLTES